MSSAARTAVDLSPPAPDRAGLALALALLSIPGVTAAWEVIPAGGVVVGLPLCVSALALARRARAHGARSGLSTAALIIAGLALFALLLNVGSELIAAL